MLRATFSLTKQSKISSKDIKKFIIYKKNLIGSFFEKSTDKRTKLNKKISVSNFERVKRANRIKSNF